MKLNEQLLRRVVRRLLTEAEDELRGDGRVRVELLSHEEASNFQFPGWFQRLLTVQGTADLIAFNKLMYDSFYELGRRQYGDVVAGMIQSKDHPEFLTLYCSLMREINPLMEVNEVVNIILELFNIWLQDERNERLWLCLTKQINQPADKQPVPMTRCLGKEARLLPRYESEDLKHAVEMGVQTLRLNAQQAQELQKNYLKLTTVMNELYHAKMGQVEIRHTLDVLKLLLKDHLTKQQLNIKDASGSAQSFNQGQTALIPLGDNKELFDDDIVGVIRDNGLAEDLTPAEKATINSIHNKIMDQFPNVQTLYQYIHGSQKMSQEVSKSYQDVKESLIGLLNENDVEKDLKAQDGKMKAFVKYLVLLINKVEEKYHNEKEQNQRQGGDNVGNNIQTDDSLGDNSIHADAEILNDFVSGVNLLQHENFVRSHVDLKLLKQDEDFNMLYPQNVLTLQLWSKKLTSLQGQAYNDLMSKYAALISKTYKHYLNLLDKLGNGEFFNDKYNDKNGKNDTPKFLYQLLYLYEKFVKLMPEYEIQKFGDQNDNDQQVEAAQILKDFNMDKFQQKFVSNNKNEMNEYIKNGSPNKNDIAEYLGIINERHPDLSKLESAVERLDEIMRGKRDEEQQAERNSFFADPNKRQTSKEERAEKIQRLKKYGVKSKKNFADNEYHEGDWDLAIFEEFNKSVKDYVSVLNKVRSGTFNYVRRYGHDTKGWVYYLLYKWEQAMKDLDIEEMIDNTKPGVLDRLANGFEEAVNAISYDEDKDEDEDEDEDESEKLNELIRKVENNDKANNFKKIFEKIYNSNPKDKAEIKYKDKTDILNNDFIIEHLNKYDELSDDIDDEYAGIDYSADDVSAEDADHDYYNIRNRESKEYKLKLIQNIFSYIDQISDSIDVKNNISNVSKDEFRDLLKAKIKSVILNNKVKEREEQEKYFREEQKGNEAFIKSLIDEEINELEGNTGNEDSENSGNYTNGDSFKDIFENIYGRKNASFEDNLEMIQAHVMSYWEAIKVKNLSEKRYFVDKIIQLITTLMNNKYRNTVLNFNLNNADKISQKEFGKKLIQLMENFIYAGNDEKKLFKLNKDYDDKYGNNKITDSISLCEMMPEQENE